MTSAESRQRVSIPFHPSAGSGSGSRDHLEAQGRTDWQSPPKYVDASTRLDFLRLVVPERLAGESEAVTPGLGPKVQLDLSPASLFDMQKLDSDWIKFATLEMESPGFLAFLLRRTSVLFQRIAERSQSFDRFLLKQSSPRKYPIKAMATETNTATSPMIASVDQESFFANKSITGRMSAMSHV